MTETLPILRRERPRLYHPVGDVDYRFAPPQDAVRRYILAHILDDCRQYENKRPVARIPERLQSPHPYHQLYITFYTAMEATAFIEHYSFAWLMTGDPRWLKKARQWLLAAARWEHSDRVEEHFYTANRYMQAFAVGLDWLAGALPADEVARATACLTGIMQRWWPQVRDGRHEKTAGHHVVVDNGHFGVAALQLLGYCDEADEWVRAIIDRFRAAIMPHGCGDDGAPVDGPTFWAPENMWLLHFADALRNVTGIDLYEEFPARLRLPLQWLRPFLVVPPQVPDVVYATPQSTILNDSGYSQLDHVAPVLLRLAQEAGDADLREIALRDPRLGRVQRYGSGVKGSTAECMLAWGPYAYLYYDPDFSPSAPETSPPLSRLFNSFADRAIAILRSDSGHDALAALVWGFTGALSHGLGRLHVQWAGHPILKMISSAESQPLGTGSVPFVGAQDEVQFTLGELRHDSAADCLTATSTRLHHEYWLLRSQPPALLVAVRRQPRDLALLAEKGEAFVRLDGDAALNYNRRPYFNPDAGELRLRVRLHRMIAPEHPAILFAAGIGVPGTALSGVGVNVFSLGFLNPDELSFRVKSNRMHEVGVSLPVPASRWLDGQWHQVAIRWGGFNGSSASPFIELECDAQQARNDDAALFGELGQDVQGLASRTTPRPFNIVPQSILSFGSAVQIPATGGAWDIAEIDLRCPRRQRLHVDFRHGLGSERGAGLLGWKLNPTSLDEVAERRVVFNAGDRRLQVLGIEPYGATFATKVVPYAPGGFAASSLKSYIPGRTAPATQVVATATNSDLLLLLFVDAALPVASEIANRQLTLTFGSEQFHFRIVEGDTALLHLLTSGTG
jgi:hypothetical protein